MLDPLTPEQPSTLTVTLLLVCAPFCPTRAAGADKGPGHRLRLAASAEWGPSGRSSANVEIGTSGIAPKVDVVKP